ncbi:GrpB family protein [Paenibacillus sp. FSL R5-0636]|uniref:GrpB family protein n=1 Tax=Paenibacillus TaxID=44249 RepID=UPI0015C394B8|nr:GrpB family protein [Paenibacillus odorifer]
MISVKDPVIIEPYSDNWSSLFKDLRAQIVTEIGFDVHRIDHIGSTAVERYRKLLKRKQEE